MLFRQFIVCGLVRLKWHFAQICGQDATLCCGFIGRGLGRGWNLDGPSRHIGLRQNGPGGAKCRADLPFQRRPGAQEEAAIAVFCSLLLLGVSRLRFLLGFLCLIVFGAVLGWI